MEIFSRNLVDKINKLPGVELLKKDGIFFHLIGGAIISAMDGTSPKDYDMLLSQTKQASNCSFMNSKGYNFICETSNAYTYEKNGMKFQFIKTDVNTFDFTISQITFKSSDNSITGDLYNLQFKNLIPVMFVNLNLKFNQLLRIPHYQKKGFKIHPSTYTNLVEQTWKLTEAVPPIRYSS